jgi:hypothetical protein
LWEWLQKKAAEHKTTLPETGVCGVYMLFAPYSPNNINTDTRLAEKINHTTNFVEFMVKQAVTDDKARGGLHLCYTKQYASSYEYVEESLTHKTPEPLVAEVSLTEAMADKQRLLKEAIDGMEALTVTQVQAAGNVEACEGKKLTIEKALGEKQTKLQSTETHISQYQAAIIALPEGGYRDSIQADVTNLTNSADLLKTEIEKMQGELKCAEDALKNAVAEKTAADNAFKKAEEKVNELKKESDEHGEVTKEDGEALNEAGSAPKGKEKASNEAGSASKGKEKAPKPSKEAQDDEIPQHFVTVYAFMMSTHANGDNGTVASDNLDKFYEVFQDDRGAFKLFFKWDKKKKCHACKVAKIWTHFRKCKFINEEEPDYIVLEALSRVYNGLFGKAKQTIFDDQLYTYAAHKIDDEERAVRYVKKGKYHHMHALTQKWALDAVKAFVPEEHHQDLADAEQVTKSLDEIISMVKESGVLNPEGPEPPAKRQKTKDSF